MDAVDGRNRSPRGPLTRAVIVSGTRPAGVRAAGAESAGSEFAGRIVRMAVGPCHGEKFVESRCGMVADADKDILEVLVGG